MEYDRVELNDLCSLSQGLQIPIAKRFREDGPNRYFYVTVQFLKDSGDKYFIENPPERVKCTSKDILVVRTGNTGQIITGVDGCFHNNFFKVEPNEKIYPKFLYYTLKSPELYARMRNVASGTTILDLKHSAFLGLDIYLPDLNNQKKIAYILDIIDQKIKTCESINKNLYQILFIYFNEIFNQEDTNGKLADIVNIRRGASPRPIKKYISDNGINWLKISDVTGVDSPFIYQIKEKIITEGKSKSVFIKKGTLVVSNSATPGIPKFIMVDTCVHDGWLVLNKYDDNLRYYLYFLIVKIRKELLNLAYGSVFNNLKTDTLKNYEISIPTENQLTKFNKLAKPAMENINSNTEEILKLSQLRDTLLPKLMSGEIDVSKINCENTITNINFLLIILHFTSKNIFSRGEYMKTKIISKIQNQMKPYLNQGQYLKLTNSLLNSLQDIDIVDRTNDINSVDNLKLLNLFLSAKEVEGCSYKTIRYYKSTIEKMLKKIKKQIYNINTDDLRKYLFDQKNKNQSSKTTIDNIRRIFSSFFSWLENEDYIIKNPVRRIHKVKMGRVVKEVLTDENLEILRDNCEEIRDLAMIELLISTGIRVGELVNLNIDDINFYERECIVFGKGESERVVYFDARTKIHLMNYIQSRKDNNPALFVTLNCPHDRLGISGVETRVRELGKKSNINKVHPHKFRRTMATNAIDKGMPIEQVQKLLGHVQIDTTMQYAMVNQSNVKLAHRKFIG